VIRQSPAEDIIAGRSAYAAVMEQLSVRLNSHKGRPTLPEWISYWLGLYGGKRLMTEAVTAVVDWAFRALPELTSVQSGGLAANLGSIRVMQKCGLALEGRETLAFAKFGGVKCEVLHHQVSRNAWVLRH